MKSDGKRNLGPQGSSPSHELRIFISSTFRDLHDEREHLIKNVFPKVRALCRHRGIEFTEIDLRWGLTQEEGTHGRVIRSCLEAIDRCRPYFIGITGSRYGYIPELYEIHKDPDLLRSFPWVEDAAINEMSITEMEFRYAALGMNSAASPAAQPPDANRSLFYFRANSEQHAHHIDSPEDTLRLEALKQIIRDGGFSVHEFADPAILGEKIYEDLVHIIKHDFGHAAPSDSAGA